MSDQMLSLYEIDLEEGINDGQPYINLPSRDACIDLLASAEAFDLLILGGGLLGVTVAHEAALHGIKVLLLARDFFGKDALSWDVRFAQALRTQPSAVIGQTRDLQRLFTERMPHLLSPMPQDSRRFPKLLSRVARRLSKLPCVDEELLIRETVLAARQEGATVVSGVEVSFVEAETSTGCYVVGGTDTVSKRDFKNRVGGVVIDPTHGYLPPTRLGSYVGPSQGLKVGGYQYLLKVEPDQSKKTIGFMSYELSAGDFIALASRGIDKVEVTVLSGNKPLSQDALRAAVYKICTEAGWILKGEISLRQVAGGFGSRYRVSIHDGIFICSHRAAWEALLSAVKIVDALVRLSPNNSSHRIKRISEKLLPGAESAAEIANFKLMARAQGISESTIDCAINRWRGRVRYIAQFSNGLRELFPGVLRGEIDLALVSDHCVTLDDITFGSLRLYNREDLERYKPILQERLEILLDR